MGTSYSRPEVKPTLLDMVIFSFPCFSTVGRIIRYYGRGGILLRLLGFF
jgi:hypothetical protein